MSLVRGSTASIAAAAAPSATHRSVRASSRARPRRRRCPGRPGPGAGWRGRRRATRPRLSVTMPGVRDQVVVAAAGCRYRPLRVQRTALSERLDKAVAAGSKRAVEPAPGRSTRARSDRSSGRGTGCASGGGRRPKQLEIARRVGPLNRANEMNGAPSVLETTAARSSAERARRRAARRARRESRSTSDRAAAHAPSQCGLGDVDVAARGGGRSRRRGRCGCRNSAS